MQVNGRVLEISTWLRTHIYSARNPPQPRPPLCLAMHRTNCPYEGTTTASISSRTPSLWECNSDSLHSNLTPTSPLSTTSCCILTVIMSFVTLYPLLHVNRLWIPGKSLYKLYVLLLLLCKRIMSGTMNHVHLVAHSQEYVKKRKRKERFIRYCTTQ